MNDKSPVKKQHYADIRSPKERPNIRSPNMRKSGKDGPSWTPTEKVRRDKAMRQFSKQGKGYGCGISQTFRDNFDLIRWSDDEDESGGKK